MRSRKDIQTQQGLVSLQGAERRRLRLLSFLLLAEGRCGRADLPAEILSRLSRLFFSL